MEQMKTRLRAFAIWQKLGYLPWRKPAAVRKKGSRDFYKGAFDNIPFLNEDAKRTFVHLLLRPGYMIRDYLRGSHDRYLAPLTSLIIFYAFFALVSAVLQPIQRPQEFEDLDELEIPLDPERDNMSLMQNVYSVVRQGYYYLNLDKHPELVDTRGKSALAALEGALRNQGIPLFLGQFFLLWFAMSLSLKRVPLKMPATAAASAYVLCQFSFFMLFALLLSFGESRSVGGALLLLLLTVDYRQMLGVSWGKGVRLALGTGLWFVVFCVLALLAVSVLVVLVAWQKGA